MYLKAKIFNIYFLQDTHFTKQDKNVIKSQWGTKKISAHISLSQGVLQYLLMIIARKRGAKVQIILLRCTPFTRIYPHYLKLGYSWKSQ